MIDLENQAIEFVQQTLADLSQRNVDVSSFEMDHICYRVETQERYEECKIFLQTRGTLLTEAPIGGRPIATYRLHQPIQHGDRKVFCIELPAPKPSTHYPEGFEHAEFVIHTDFSTFLDQHSNLEFDCSAMNKDRNPDIRLGLTAGSSVKFHRQTLEKVIEEELRESKS